jgi:type I restriction enzyme S subunit
MAKSELPKGWEWKKLGEICSFQGVSQPPKSQFSNVLRDGYVRLVQIRDYKTDAYPTYVPRSSVRRFCEADDVMIGRYGPTLFQILRGIKGTYNVALMKASPDESELSKGYLFYLLKDPQLRSKVVASSLRSAGQTGVRKELLEEHSVSVPPLLEQHRIVARIEELLNRIEQAKSLRQKSLTETSAIMPSALHEVFGSIRNGYDVSGVPLSETRNINEVCRLQRGKFSHRPRNDPRFFGGAIPWIQINDIPKEDKLIQNYTDTLNAQGLAISKLFPKGTIVISIAATIGTVGILAFDACFPDSLVGITPNPNLIQSSFLYYQLSFIQSHLDSIAPYAAQKNINVQILNKLKLWVPPFETQRRIDGERGQALLFDIFVLFFESSSDF